MAGRAGIQGELTPTEAAEEALGHARHLAEQIGPRPVGSPEEYGAARYAEERLREAGVSETRRQEFAAPASVWLPFAVATAVAMLGIGLWMLARGSFFGAYLGALGCGFALWEIWAELNFGWSPLSSVIPKRKSRNVIGTVAPTEGEGRNAVLLAHLDTQRTPIFSRSRGGLTLWVVAFYATVVVLFLTLLAFVVSWFGEFRLPLIAGVPLLVLAVPSLLILLHTETTPYTAGANDNASSVGLALALARHYAARPMRNTRLWVVFTGAEETGCHGAAAFLQDHADDLLQGYVLALEGLGVSKPAYSLREGMLGSYRSNTELVRLAERVGRDDPSLGLRPVKLRAGYTEAGMSMKRGHRAMALVGMAEDGTLPYWHSPQDTADKLDPEALAAAYGAITEILARLDAMPVSVKLSRIKPLSERS